MRLRQPGGPRNHGLAWKIPLMLTALVLLWVFAFVVTTLEGWNLIQAGRSDTQVGRPTLSLVTELQEERRTAQVYLAQRAEGQAAWTRQRKETDKRLADWREHTLNAGGQAAEQIAETAQRLKRLETVRKQIDTGSIDRSSAHQEYSTTIGVALEIGLKLADVDDKGLAAEVRALVQLNEAREMLSREDALVAGVLAAGRLEAGDQARIVQAVGVQRNAFTSVRRRLAESDRTRLDGLLRSPQYAALQSLEERLMRPVRAGARPPVDAQRWQQATQPLRSSLDNIINVGGDEAVDRAAPGAVFTFIRWGLAGGLGLVAVIAAIVVSITTSRRLVAELGRLRSAAIELAEKRLPSVVERIGHGEKVDVAAEAPPLEFGTDVIGQVGQAFNAVQETALRTAVEQAELRRAFRDVLLSLARRTQTLVHRQLSLLDQLERQPDIDPKDLQELFRLDHLATRMRRNAENLIVLSGAIPARGWRKAVPMVDVVRAAIGEVEDYTRVQVLQFGPVELAGRAVGDITHLLAELIENAVSFSPPDTVVQVGGHRVASGYAIDIEDRGLGMTDEKLAEVNARIADPPEFNLQSSVQLGLFVVGTLAERYGLQVMLKRSAYGGTTAVVVIPNELVNEAEWEDKPTPKRSSATTTQNGLQVRQPAPAEAMAGRANGRHGQQGPALVAVPDPDTDRPSRRQDDARPGGNGAVRAPVSKAPEKQSPTTTGEPLDLPPVPEVTSTPSGLPVRVPQAHLATPLKTDQPLVDQDEPEDLGRSPEEIQRIMGSFQSGSRRGRSDAANRHRRQEPRDEQ